MTELIFWGFLVLLQQQGLTGGVAPSEKACVEARDEVLKDAKDLGQEILAVSECQQIVLKRYTPGK